MSDRNWEYVAETQSYLHKSWHAVAWADCKGRAWWFYRPSGAKAQDRMHKWGPYNTVHDAMRSAEVMMPREIVRVGFETGRSRDLSGAGKAVLA